MSSDKETTDYIELRPGDKVQVGDQWLDQFGQWHFYTHSGSAGGFVDSGVKARRPIPTTHQTTYEEVPGSRTTQDTVVQPQRERIAYEDLRPGEIIQDGDQWQNECGRWRPFLVLAGSRVQVRQSQRVRRPYNITQLQDERDKWQRQFAAERSAREAAIVERNEAERLLAEAQMQRDKAWSDQKVIQACRDTALQELTQAREASQQLLKTIADNADQFAEHTKVLEQERDDLQTALIESRLEQKRKVAEVMEVCKERDEACRERDLARAEVARLSTELWARKPLEERIASLTHELANAAVDGYNLQHERDETRAEVKRLQEVVGNLYNEPTARQVQEMLRTWATELDWSAGCFDSAAREQIDTIQRTLIAVIERIETMINPEGSSDGE